MSLNLANILEGPAVLQYKDIVLEFRGGLKPTASTQSFEITSDLLGVIDNRSKECSIKIAGTPTGVWTPEHLSVLFPYGDFPTGQMVTRVLELEEIDTGTGQVTITAHGLRSGCPVSMGTYGVLPAPLAEGTTFYIEVVDADTVRFHTTLASVSEETPTALVTFTDEGEDESYLVEQEPVTIWSSLGRKLTFHVGALTKMPDLTFSAVETLLGGLEFECFRKNNTPWSTANSLFTITKAPLTLQSPGRTSIPTREYTYGWGSTAPWASFKSRGPAKVSFDLQLAEVSSDADGLLSRKVSSVKANCTAAPAGISESAMLAALNMQGSGAARGSSLSAAALNIAGTGVYGRLYNAQLTEVPMNFDTTNPRAGEFKWSSGREITEAGVIQPVFAFSTTALS